MVSSNDKRDELDTQSGGADPTGAVDTGDQTRIEDAEILDASEADTSPDQDSTNPDEATDPSENPEAADAETADAGLGADDLPDDGTTPTESNVDTAITPEPVVEQPVAAAPAKSGGGFMPGFAGGIAAAVVGFGTAQFLEVDWLKLGGGEDVVASALGEQSAAISQQAELLAGLEARLAEMSESVANPDTSALETTISSLAGQVESDVGALSAGIISQLGQVTDTLSGLSGAVEVVENRLEGVDGSLGALDGGLAAVTSGLDGVKTQLGAVDERLVAVEKRPLVESTETAKATFLAYEREVQRLTDSLAAQKNESAETAKRMAELAALTEAQITAVQEEAAARLASMQNEAAQQIEATREQTALELQEAETSVRTAAVTAALIDLEKALEEGAPYDDALETLSEATDVPEGLSSYAKDGVQTYASVRDAYPAAARAALEASLKDVSTEADPVGKLTAFFRAQTGARSLEPREGDDPDAVLSRAEDKIKSGDLEGAIAELGALPDGGQAALSDWMAAAKARVDALDAAAALSDSFPTN